MTAWWKSYFHFFTFFSVPTQEQQQNREHCFCTCALIERWTDTEKPLFFTDHCLRTVRGAFLSYASQSGMPEMHHRMCNIFFPNFLHFLGSPEDIIYSPPPQKGPSPMIQIILHPEIFFINPLGGHSKNCRHFYIYWQNLPTKLGYTPYSYLYKLFNWQIAVFYINIHVTVGKGK